LFFPPDEGLAAFAVALLSFLGGYIAEKENQINKNKNNVLD